VKARSTLASSIALAGALGAAVAWAQAPKPRPGDTEWVAPAEEKVKTAPFPSTAEGIARGRALYQKHCTLCHGESGRGDGPLAKLHAQRTSKPPYDLTDPEVQVSLTDGEVFWKVSAGFRKGSQVIMPAFKPLIPGPEDRWKVVQYVRTLVPSKAGASR
jgi:mono/diheme cytochrome c family protein